MVRSTNPIPFPQMPLEAYKALPLATNLQSSLDAKDSVANLLEHCKEIVDIGCDNNLIIRCLFIYAKKYMCYYQIQTSINLLFKSYQIYKRLKTNSISKIK